MKKGKMKTTTLTAPSHWASYLINGEQGDLHESELDLIISWLESQGMYDKRNQSGPIHPVSCGEDAGFMWRHDAINFRISVRLPNLHLPNHAFVITP